MTSTLKNSFKNVTPQKERTYREGHLHSFSRLLNGDSWLVLSYRKDFDIFDSNWKKKKKSSTESSGPYSC